VILGIDHIGLATEDPAGVASFLTALGLYKSDEGTADAYGVSCEFWRYPASDRPAVEVVAPAGARSTLTDHLTRSGPGLYHVAFHVDDVEFELARLRRNGFVAIDQEPCAGARPGMRVAFMYIRKPAGLLIELVEYSTNGQPRDRTA